MDMTMNLSLVKILHALEALRSRHRHSWRITDVELGLHSGCSYLFDVIQLCPCGATYARTYLYEWVILKLAQQGVRHESYQPAALKLLHQMQADIDSVAPDEGKLA
jgi:hypothetical protein